MPAIVKIMINGTRVVYLPVGDTSGICCKRQEDGRWHMKMLSMEKKTQHSMLILSQFCSISVAQKMIAIFLKLAILHF
jgi:hypothetical protein